MKRQRGETSSGGIGVFGLLGIIFVVLKILDIKPVGDWSWWWVTAPFWLGFVVLASVIAIFVWLSRR
jgi:small Trp-rich protein